MSDQEETGESPAGLDTINLKDLRTWLGPKDIAECAENAGIGIAQIRNVIKGHSKNWAATQLLIARAEENYHLLQKAKELGSIKPDLTGFRHLKDWLYYDDICQINDEVGLSMWRARRIIAGKTNDWYYLRKMVERAEKNKELIERGDKLNEEFKAWQKRQ